MQKPNVLASMNKNSKKTQENELIEKKLQEENLQHIK